MRAEPAGDPLHGGAICRGLLVALGATCVVACGPSDSSGGTGGGTSGGGGGGSTDGGGTGGNGGTGATDANAGGTGGTGAGGGTGGSGGSGDCGHAAPPMTGEVQTLFAPAGAAHDPTDVDATCDGAFTATGHFFGDLAFRKKDSSLLTLSETGSSQWIAHFGS